MIKNQLIFIFLTHKWYINIWLFWILSFVLLTLKWQVLKLCFIFWKLWTVEIISIMQLLFIKQQKQLLFIFLRYKWYIKACILSFLLLKILNVMKKHFFGTCCFFELEWIEISEVFEKEKGGPGSCHYDRVGVSIPASSPHQ